MGSSGKKNYYNCNFDGRRPEGSKYWFRRYIITTRRGKSCPTRRPATARATLGSARRLGITAYAEPVTGWGIVPSSQTAEPKPINTTHLWGYDSRLLEAFDDWSGRVCRLIQPLYHHDDGLKISGNLNHASVWNEEFSSTVALSSTQKKKGMIVVLWTRK